MMPHDLPWTMMAGFWKTGHSFKTRPDLMVPNGDGGLRPEKDLPR